MQTTDELREKANGLRRAVNYGIQNGKRNMIVDLDVLNAILSGEVPVGGNELPPEDVTARLYETKSQRDDEAWMHAACLTIAETGQKWGENVKPSLAMDAVYKLRQERDELHRQVNALIESCYYRTAAGKVHWKQGRWFGTSTAPDTDPLAFEQAMVAIRHNAGIGEVELPELPEGT